MTARQTGQMRGERPAQQRAQTAKWLQGNNNVSLETAMQTTQLIRKSNESIEGTPSGGNNADGPGTPSCE